MNNQQTLDKAGTRGRLKIMKNETQSIYGLLVRSEDKGRSIMETAVYAMCIVSAVAGHVATRRGSGSEYKILKGRYRVACWRAQAPSLSFGSLPKSFQTLGPAQVLLGRRRQAADDSRLAACAPQRTANRFDNE